MQSKKAPSAGNQQERSIKLTINQWIKIGVFTLLGYFILGEAIFKLVINPLLGPIWISTSQLEIITRLIIAVAIFFYGKHHPKF